jgi:hypothetical protein
MIGNASRALSSPNANNWLGAQIAWLNKAVIGAPTSDVPRKATINAALPVLHADLIEFSIHCS